MSAQIISVDPLKRDDPYYRYKMPEILLKIESSGNGVKTVFPNIRDVCERLNRPEEIMIKFFGYELGTQSTVVKKDDKFIVQGSQDKERIHEKVDAFITKFVLCSHCRNPETDPYVEGKKVLMNCRGCGKTTTLNAAERAHSLFVSLYSGKKAPVANKGMTEAANKTEEAPAATTAAPTKELKSAIKGEAAAPVEQENPIELLTEALEQFPNQPKVLERKVYDLRAQFGLDDAFVVRLVFRGIMGTAAKKPNKPAVGALQTHIELVKRFADKTELQKVLIDEAKFNCHDLGIHHRFPMMMKMFVEMNALKESEFILWAEAEEKAPKSSKKKAVPHEVVVDYKEKCKPLVDWIKA